MELEGFAVDEVAAKDEAEDFREVAAEVAAEVVAEVSAKVAVDDCGAADVLSSTELGGPLVKKIYI